MVEDLLKYGYELCRLIGNSLNDIENEKLFCDTEQLYKLAKIHNIVPMFYSATNKLIDDEKLSVEIREKSNDLIFKQMRLEAVEQKLFTRLEAEKIPYLPLKGINFRSLYPKDFIRLSTDIDIYVSHENIEKVSKILSDDGYVIEDDTVGEICFIKNSKYCVEVHRRIDGDEKDIKLFNEMANRCMASKDNFQLKLTEEDFYILALYHLYKHFVYGGCGIRMFLDIYMINKSVAIDNSVCDKYLCELDLLKFRDVVNKLCGVMFDGKESSDEMDMLSAYVFSSGNFGTLEHINLSKIMNNSNDNNSRIKYFGNKWLSFSKMKQRYDILNKIPILLPFCYVHRVFMLVFCKPEVLQKRINQYSQCNNEAINRRTQLLKLAGIENTDVK